MSLIGRVVATPSRVRGIYRTLLQIPRQQIDQEELERIVSPTALQGSQESTVRPREVILEMLDWALLERKQNILMINPQLPQELRNSDMGDEHLAFWMADRMFSHPSEDNQVFLSMLAWYLAQDQYNAPGEWKMFQERMIDQKIRTEFNNDAKYGQFEDWIVFFGFALMNGRKRQMTPYPLPYVKYLLPRLFQDETYLPIDDAVNRLAGLCPVFENGKIREAFEKEQHFENRRPRYLSSVTSSMWLLLQDEGEIQLESRSDADVYIFVEGSLEHRFSGITRLKKGV
jgi:hypothetical protein